MTIFLHQLQAEPIIKFNNFRPVLVTKKRIVKVIIYVHDKDVRHRAVPVLDPAVNVERTGICRYI